MKQFCLLLLGFVLLLCMGCTKQWSEETGYIFRDDIEPGDFAFLFNEWEFAPDKTDKENALELYNALKHDLRPDDIFAVLGFPETIIENSGRINYGYLIGDEYDSITIIYNKDENEIFDVKFGIESIETDEEVENLTMLLSKGGTIEPEKYKMRKRFDIKEDDLSFISEDTTSRKIQQVLGAPHSYIEARDVNLESVSGNAFVYGLTNGDAFKVIYFRQGYILRAWVEDNDGNETKLYIDRDVTSFYEQE
jgi:hypothetical protein